MKLLALLFSIAITINTYSQTRLPGSQNQLGSNDEGNTINFTNEKELKNDIEQTGLAVANRLLKCCSKYGGNNVSADIIWEGVRLSKMTGDFTIPMKVNWYGSLSGNHYWIKGRLIVHSNGSKEWLKESDSGGFAGGCSGGCIN